MSEHNNIRLPTRDEAYLFLLRTVPALPFALGALSDIKYDQFPALTAAGATASALFYLLTAGPRTSREITPIENPDAAAQAAYRQKK